jgi:hypothetical protein
LLRSPYCKQQLTRTDSDLSVRNGVGWPARAIWSIGAIKSTPAKYAFIGSTSRGLTSITSGPSVVMMTEVAQPRRNLSRGKTGPLRANIRVATPTRPRLGGRTTLFRNYHPALPQELTVETELALASRAPEG